MTTRASPLAVWCVASALGVAAPTPAGAEEGWKREGTTLSRGSFEFRPTGYVQGDFRSYQDWEAGDADTGLLRAETSELRRLRVGFEAEWGPLAFEFDADPRGDSGDSLEDNDWLKDAFADIRFAKGLRLRGGHFKLPFSGEFLTSAAKTDFIERAMTSAQLGGGRALGGMLHGQPLRWLEYQAGVFANDDRVAFGRAGTTAAGRLIVGLARGVDVAAAYSQGDVEAEPESPQVVLSPKGLAGDSPTGYRYSVRRFVNGRRRRLGGELTIRRGPVGVNGEVLQAREERLGQSSTFTDLPEEVATGWAASLTCLLTGERKQRTIEPRRSFPHGPGAIELGVRFEELRFDDDGPDEGFAGAGNRARNIRPAADRALTAGLSWWPTPVFRVMGNVLVERYEDPLLAPEPGRRGNYVTLLGRLQFQLP